MHNEGFGNRKMWEEQQSRQYISIINRELTALLKLDSITTEVANLDLDCKHSTDYLSSATRSGVTKHINIACRARRSGCKYRDLTIRSSYYGSDNTEINKLKDAHYYLYCWCTGNKVKEYIFVDIRKLMASGLLNEEHDTHYNNDDANSFISISIPELKKAGYLISYKKKRAK